MFPFDAILSTICLECAWGLNNYYGNTYACKCELVSKTQKVLISLITLKGSLPKIDLKRECNVCH